MADSEFPDQRCAANVRQRMAAGTRFVAREPEEKTARPASVEDLKLLLRLAKTPKGPVSI